MDIIHEEDLNILEVIHDDGNHEGDQKSNLQAQLKTTQNFFKSGGKTERKQGEDTT